MINNEVFLPPSLSACPEGQYSHYRANLLHKYQSWIYNVEYEDDTVVNDGWDQIIHDPGSSTARWRTLCGKERSDDCILSYISTSWSSCRISFQPRILIIIFFTFDLQFCQFSCILKNKKHLSVKIKFNFCSAIWWPGPHRVPQDARFFKFKTWFYFDPTLGIVAYFNFIKIVTSQV